MKIAIAVVLLCGIAVAQIAVPVLAQPPEAAKPLAPGEGARIEGMVRDTKGQPIARANVRLIAAPGENVAGLPMIATTGEDGTFVLDGIPPGANYRMPAERQGYARNFYGASRANNNSGLPFTLARGQVQKGIVIELSQQAVISGTVTDLLGDPRPSAMVSVMRRGYQGGVRRMLAAGSAVANDLGEFRVANLAPGTYYLRASDRVTQIPGAEAGLPTYYPSAAQERDARAVTVGPGDEVRGIDIRMGTGRMYSISGKAIGADGKPAANVPLIALPADGPLPNAISIQSSGPDGSFRIVGLAPGPWVVQNVPNATLSVSVRHSVTVVDKDLTDVSLQASARKVTGSVRLEGGDLKDLLARAKPTVVLVTAGPMADSRNGPVKEDGSLEIAGVPPGTPTVNVNGLPDNVYLKSHSLGETTLEIVLSPKGASVVGTTASPGLGVTLWPVTADTSLPGEGLRTVISDQNRAFEFKRLPPGEYYLVAWEDADPGLVAYRPFFEKFADRAVKIAVAEGAQQALEAPMISSEAYRIEEEKLR